MARTQEPLAGVTILVVDDNPDVTELTALGLENLGAQVTTGYNGAQARKHCRETAFDVLLLDLALPDIYGHDLARSLREECKDNPKILIAMSGYATDDLDTADCFDHLLVKPVSAQLLSELIRELLEI